MASAGFSTDVVASAQYDQSSGRIRVTNGRLELVIDTKSGLNPNSLRDSKTGRVYADTDYVWSAIKTPMLTKQPEIKYGRNGSTSVKLTAADGALSIEQIFSASPDEPGVIVERITIRNIGTSKLDTSKFGCGFAKKISNAHGWLRDVANSRFCNIPYRVQTDTGAMCDYDLTELTTKPAQYFLMTLKRLVEDPVYGAEAWAWYERGNTLMISKYNNDALEWSLLVPTRGDVEDKTVRFGGAGIWKMGDPDGAASLAPRGSFTFGETRYQILDGEWKQAYSEYRKFTESKGHKTPKGYNPPVQWNELYDNPFWWAAWPSSDTPELRAKLYRREDMAIEAQKAQEFGCEALYLDPGWDTRMGSNIWADDRLGTLPDFVKWLRKDYGIKLLALHTPLAPWTDAAGYPDEARRWDKDGKPTNEVCTASPVYMREKIARLKKLCSVKELCFLMYDGSWWGECWNPSHGHSLPCSRQEHVEAILHMQQEVHKAYPKVLIEQHDPVIGPCYSRYAPAYFQHSKPYAWDEIWGLEYMWSPFEDLASRKAHSLYYMNLAYSIPIYLHYDMRADNKNAVLFWWFASTCRHLGVGGKHKDPAVWEAQKAAMQVYVKNKRFFTQGVFYGIDEYTHIHTLADRRECLINCFNLTNEPVERKVSIRLQDIGLPKGKVTIDGMPSPVEADQVNVSVNIPAMGHRLVKIGVR